MLDHRTAAAGRAPHGAPCPRPVSLIALLRTDGSRALRRWLATGCRRASVALLEQRGGAGGCGRGWSAHLAYVELLRLHVQSSAPERRGA